MNAQQLKNSILQEAIEGRLVPQDPNDEPASVLLDKIRKEKARLVKEGKLKKKDLEEIPISEDEKPFEIPKSWEWVRISDISESFIGLTYKPTDVSTNGWIVLRSSNIQEGILDYNDIVKVNVEVSEKLRVRVNDIIICARNGSKKLVGKSALVREVNEPTTFGAFMAICRTQFYEYIAKYLLSPLFFQQLRKDSDTTTINQLTQKNFNRYLVPLPPLAEQKRIVAKIEELLPKVKAYGKAQESLDKLNEELPERLKKSILQEAIEGRLVPQDPNDEPASVLLEKIRKEKAKLVKEGKLKKKDLEETTISEDETPFKIPEGWVWVKLQNIGYFMSGQTPKSSDLKDTEGGVPYFKVSDMNVKGNEHYMNYAALYLKANTKYKLFPKNSIIYPKNGGALLTNKKRILVTDSLVDLNTGAFVPSYELDFEYIFHLFSTIDFRKHYKGTALPTVNMESIHRLLFPLPPLSEQHRIVAKIEQLMKEIDKLNV